MKTRNSQRSKIHLPIPTETEQVGKQVLDAAFRVHTSLGPGLLESAYEACVVHELRQIGLDAKTQVALPVIYDDVKLNTGYRVDLLVENCVIAEFKAVEKMLSLYEAQLLTYLKLANVRLGYLINFNVVRLKNGIKRMVR